MKTKIIWLALSLLPGLGAAQSNYLPAHVATTAYQTGSLRAQSKPNEPAYQRNIIKTNLSSVILNNYSFSYERTLTPNVSVVAGYGFMPQKTVADVALVKRIAERYIYNEAITSELDQITSSANTFTGEVRLYPGKKPGARGFYASLYGRYMKMDVNYLDTYRSVTNKPYQIPYHSNHHGIGGGLMLGAQWLIANRISLDWYVLGAHYGKLKGDVDAATDLSAMTPAEKAGLEEDIEHYVEIGGKRYMDATVTDDGVRAKADGPFFGVRGLGINIGIAF